MALSLPRTVAPLQQLVDHTRRQTALRLLPFLFILYVTNYLDRTSLAYAAIGMRRDVGFSDNVTGFAIGVFGVGMGGTAISNFTTVKLTQNYGVKTPFLLVAALLLVYAVVSYLLLRDAPGRKPSPVPPLRATAAVARLTVTWQMCFLYAVGFGGFVAFSTYEPALSVPA